MSDSEDRLRDDFRRFEYECPRCGAVLHEYAGQCPECGQNLFEAFSGTFRPRRRRGVKILVLVVLGLFLVSMLAVSVVSLHALLQGR